MRGPFSARFLFCLRLMTLGPMKPNMAGRRVRAATMVRATPMAAATARPYRKLTPRANMPEQRDAHDDPGEQHGPARRVDRVDDGGLDVAAGHEALAMPGHDEEGVVDADPQSDEQHELGRDRRHPEDVAQHADDADGRAQGEQRGEDREDGGEERAEDEQQHDQRQQHAEAGAAEGLVVGVLGQLAR